MRTLCVCVCVWVGGGVWVWGGEVSRLYRGTRECESVKKL